MAKKSSVENNERRRKLVKKFAGKRARLLAIANDESQSMDERFLARLKLAELPRNSASNRVRNRCEVTGRPRAVLPQAEDVAHRFARARQQGAGSRPRQVELVRRTHHGDH